MTTTTSPVETAPPPVPTATLLPPTDTPDPTITPEPDVAPTPWPFPFDPPTGQIFFFYASETWFDTDYERLMASEYNLYRADATGDPAGWSITTIFTQTLPGFVQLSPDENRLALRLIHDTDRDGRLRSTGYTPDLSDIFVYDLPQASMQQLTVSDEEGQSPSNFLWLPDSQSLLAIYSGQIVKIPVAGAALETVLALSEFAFLGNMTLSPDGNTLVFTTSGPVINPELGTFQGNTLLHMFELDTETLTLVHDENNGAFSIIQPAWSLDSRSLVFGNALGSILMMDTDTLEMSPLAIAQEGDRVTSTGWSVDGRWLGVIQNQNSFLLWDSATETTTELLAGDEFRNPVWSPQENQIAITLVNDGHEELLLIDAETSGVQTLLPASTGQRIRPYSWSPDGNWLLLLLEEPEQSGLFILHPDTDALFQIIDTTEGLVGYIHIWVP
jgi:Tol biopolymer transport system component